jgi:4-hydroxy-4-methyl-2-oxoglutarate aldolase
VSDYVDLFHQRYSTALLADAAYRAGVPVGVPPSGLAPLERRDRLAGPVVTVEVNNDLVTILGAVHRARPGDVIVLTNRTAEVALLGDLLATEAQRKGLAGFIADGLVRDVGTLLDIGLPVICRGALPVGPLKLPAELKGVGQSSVEVTLGDARVTPGDWAFGDADGAIFLGADHLPAVFEQAEQSWEREEALTAEIRAGAALGDLLGIEAFLAKRAEDPAADFNAHLAELGRAI